MTTTTGHGARTLQGLTIRMALVALLASLLAASPALGPPRAAEASPASSRTLDLDEWSEGAGPGEGMRAQSGGEARSSSDSSRRPDSSDPSDSTDEGWFVTEVPAGDSVMAGLELPEGEEAEVEFRSRHDGEWSDWTPTEFPGAEDGPDPDSEEAQQARENVTEPVWFGEAEKVQVRVSGTRTPHDARLHTVDIDGPLEFDPLDAGAGAAHAQPNIIGRSQWDPNNECRPRTSPSVASNARFTVIHHTAGSNGYTQAQAASQLRGICLYHRNALGWSDIGYNLVVDRYGRTYEGRAGGVTRAVVGAHAANYNTGSFGVSVMGCFDSSCSSSLGSNALPKAALDAVDRVVAWKFSIHNIDPYARISYRNGAGNTVTLDTIVGHRDVGQTSCPGSNFAPYVRGSQPMKHRVAPLITNVNPYRDHEWVEGDFNGDGRTDVAGFDRQTGRWRVGTSNGSSFSFSIWNRFSTGKGWRTHQVGDFNGNGRDDILSFHAGTGNWILQTADGASFRSSVWTRFSSPSGWVRHRAADVTGNGVSELVSFHSGTGNWVVTRRSGSKGASSVWERFKTRTGWRTFVGDVTGNGREDLVNFHAGTGNWMVSRSLNGRFDTSRWLTYRTTKGWQSHQLGDVTGNGRADLLSYHPGSGNLVMSTSNGRQFSNQGVWRRFKSKTGWGAHRMGDVTGDGRMEWISFHNPTGRWIVTRQLHPDLVVNGVVQRDVRSSIWGQYPTGSGWAHHGIGDVNRNGRADMMSFNLNSHRWWTARSQGDSFATSAWAKL
jgi:hypothetical protein